MARRETDDTVTSQASDEETPLRPDHKRIEHKADVYSFMLFQPPLSRRKTGHYWTIEVVIAFMLLCLNVTLQVGLTFIAGNKILENSKQFQTTLVGLDQETTPWLQTLRHVEHQHDILHNDVKEMTIGGEEAPPTTECCNGAECSELKMPCCDRTGASPHTAHEPMRKQLTNEDVQKMPGGNNASFLQFLKPASKKKKKKDDESGDTEASVNALCQKYGRNKTLFCTPPSYQFVDMWHNLDRNGDGEWTLEEARADEANLGCKLGLPVEEVFRSTCRGVQRDNEDTSENPPYNVHLVPLSVTERRSVPKAYFDWWRGLAVICVAHDVARCGELVSKGMFDGAIGAGHRFTKGGVQDLDSALDYCQRLLRQGGMCEKTLPGAYMMYRSRVAEKCGPAAYSTGPRYTNPYDDRDVMSTIKVKYSLVDEYDNASTPGFCFFQGLILFLWFVNLVKELKSIIELTDFVYSFDHDNHLPLLTKGMRRSFRSFTGAIRRSLSMSSQEVLSARTDEDSEDDMKEKDDHDSDAVIKKISRAHKGMVTMMLVVRFIILCYMFHVGSMFLLTNHKYDDLLLNAVALAFIFELPEFIYSFLVSDEMQSELEEAHTVDFVTSLPTHGCAFVFLSKSLWGICIIPTVVLIVVVYNLQVTTMPSLHALKCTCFQEGDTCDVATRFSRNWWNAYWKDIAVMFETSSVFR